MLRYGCLRAIRRPRAARFSGDLEWLKQQGVEVRRFNLAQNPAAFAGHSAVKQALAARGNDCLPLVLVDERVAVEGSYPSRETLAALTGVVIRKLALGSSCCGPGSANVASKKSGCC